MDIMANVIYGAEVDSVSLRIFSKVVVSKLKEVGAVVGLPAHSVTQHEELTAKSIHVLTSSLCKFSQDLFLP